MPTNRNVYVGMRKFCYLPELCHKFEISKIETFTLHVIFNRDSPKIKFYLLVKFLKNKGGG